MRSTTSYRIARLILRDFDSAEDAVQEALVRCWRDLPRQLRIDPSRRMNPMSR
jgi:DNA-directed RNA polymerase specialized sigma24 family protein